MKVIYLLKYDRAYSNVFGLEPNYPSVLYIHWYLWYPLSSDYRCCTVNHPQGWPKFVSNAFLKTPDQASLVHLYLGPFSTSTTLSSGQLGHFRIYTHPFGYWFVSFAGNSVTVNVDTTYPFSDTLHTTITATNAFTYYVRIPSWVSKGTIAINGRTATAVSPSNGLQAVDVSAGTTTFVLNLPAQITTGMLIHPNPPCLNSHHDLRREPSPWLCRCSSWTIQFCLR